MTDKNLRKAILIGLFITPFIPLLVSNTMFFPFITGKNFTFRIIVEICTALWLILAFRNPEYRPSKSPILLSFAAFIGVLFIADVTSVNTYRSFFSNFERMEGFFGTLHLFLYFVLLTSLIKTKTMWSRFWNTSLAASVMVSIYGLFQFFGKVAIDQGNVRIDSRLGNATYLGVYLLFHIFIAVYYLVRRRKEWGWVVGYSAIIVLHLFVLYYTATRGAILGLMGGLLVAIGIIAFREKGWPRKIAIGSTIALSVLVVGFISIRNTDFVQKSSVLNRFSTFQDSTVLSRTYIYPLSFRGFLEHPILGWGQENYNLVFNKYYDPHLYGQEQWFDRSHNVFLDWLISAGIFGLAAYLALFVSAFYLLWRPKGDQLSFHDRAIIAGLLLGYFAQNLTVFDNLTSYILFVGVLSYLHVKTQVAGEEAPLFRDVRMPKEMQAISAAVVVVVLAGALYFGNAKPIFAAQDLLKALNPQQGGAQQNFDYFKSALAENSFGTAEAREQLIVFAAQVVDSRDVPTELKQTIATFARDEILKQIDAAPTDSRYRLFAGSFFEHLHLYDDATVQLQKAVEYSPNKQTLAFELAAIELTTGKYEEAYQLMKKTYEADTTFLEARKIYAVAAVYAGHEKEAEDVLVPVFGTVVIDDTRILLAFVSQKDYAHVMQFWNMKLAQNPNDARAHEALGATYWAMEQKTKAITEFRTAVKINPSLKDEIVKQVGNIF